MKNVIHINRNGKNLKASWKDDRDEFDFFFCDGCTNAHWIDRNHVVCCLKSNKCKKFYERTNNTMEDRQ